MPQSPVPSYATRPSSRPSPTIHHASPPLPCPSPCPPTSHILPQSRLALSLLLHPRPMPVLPTKLPRLRLLPHSRCRLHLPTAHLRQSLHLRLLRGHPLPHSPDSHHIDLSLRCTSGWHLPMRSDTNSDRWVSHSAGTHAAASPASRRAGSYAQEQGILFRTARLLDGV